MARLRDIRERLHQPFFDTLVRGIGISSVQNNFQLFGNANVGNRALTNLQVAGQLAADQVYLLKALRCVTYFQGLNDSEFISVAAGGNQLPNLPGLSNVLSGNARAQDLYMLTAYGAQFTLRVGTKDMLSSGLWYVPQGGGPFGMGTANDRHVITNGMPTQEAILKIAKDITFSVRQNFTVVVEWFPFVRLGNGAGGGGANIGADIDPLAYLNQFDGTKLIQFHLDGLLTRDVQ